MLTYTFLAELFVKIGPKMSHKSNRLMQFILEQNEISTKVYDFISCCIF